MLLGLLAAPVLSASPLRVDIKTVGTDRLPKLYPRLIRATDQSPAGAGTQCYLVADTANNGLGTRTDNGLRLAGDDTIVWQGGITGQSPILRPGCFAGYGIPVPASLARSPLYLVAVEPMEGAAGPAVGVARLGVSAAPELGNPTYFIQADVILHRQVTNPVAEVSDTAAGGGGVNNPGTGEPSGPGIAFGPLVISRLPEQDGAVVRFPTTWGVQYRLESKPVADSPEWESLGTVLGNGGEAEIVVGVDDELRLFRLRLTTP